MATHSWDINFPKLSVFFKAFTHIIGVSKHLLWQFKTKAFPEHRILFTREINGIYQVFSGDEEGDEIQLTNSPSPSWRPRFNPDRTKIAFLGLVGIEKHLFTIDKDGSNLQQVTDVIPLETINVYAF